MWCPKPRILMHYIDELGFKKLRYDGRNEELKLLYEDLVVCKMYYEGMGRWVRGDAELVIELPFDNIKRRIDVNVLFKKREAVNALREVLKELEDLSSFDDMIDIICELKRYGFVGTYHGLSQCYSLVDGRLCRHCRDYGKTVLVTARMCLVVVTITIKIETQEVSKNVRNVEGLHSFLSRLGLELPTVTEMQLV